MEFRPTRRFVAVFLVWASAVAVYGAAAKAEVLFEDDFNGDSLDSAKWDFHVVWLEPTQMRDSAHSDAIVMTGETVMLPLETHNPTALVPGDSFYGTDITMSQSFAVADGLCIDVRMRLVASLEHPLVRGYIGAGFLFEDSAESTWDEIDAPEMLSNDADDATGGDDVGRRILTNVFDDYPTNPDKPQFVQLPLGSELTEFTKYRLCVNSDRVDWYILDASDTPVLVRTETELVPDAPMNWHFNVHVPGPCFVDAYDPDLRPAANPDANETFYLEVDYVRVIPEPSVNSMRVAGITALAALSCLGRKRKLTLFRDIGHPGYPAQASLV